MPGSNAYSGRARGLMINFHAKSRPKPSDAISHAISHADVFFDACACLSYDNDNTHVDADVFFDAQECFDDNAEIETRANDIVSDKTCSSIRMLSLWLWAARRAARGAKTALVTLKYIATHELTGVLQPITGDPKRLYVPRRQIQTCIMLLVFMGMILSDMCLRGCNVCRLSRTCRSYINHVNYGNAFAYLCCYVRHRQPFFVQFCYERSPTRIVSNFAPPIF
jgi:hypothetical protein